MSFQFFPEDLDFLLKLHRSLTCHVFSFKKSVNLKRVHANWFYKRRLLEISLVQKKKSYTGLINQPFERVCTRYSVFQNADMENFPMNVRGLI